MRMGGGSKDFESSKELFRNHLSLKPLNMYSASPTPLQK